MSERLTRAALGSLIPPPRLHLSDWIEREICLPDDVSALPGPIRLYPFQRGIADAISDPAIERITVVKSARIGYTTLLIGTLAAHVVNEPAAVLFVLPTADDCRNFMVSRRSTLPRLSPVSCPAISPARMTATRCSPAASWAVRSKSWRRKPLAICAPTPPAS
jgi:phage terminase large subunit GpA-like protein